MTAFYILSSPSSFRLPTLEQLKQYSLFSPTGMVLPMNLLRPRIKRERPWQKNGKEQKCKGKLRSHDPVTYTPPDIKIFSSLPIGVFQVVVFPARANCLNVPSSARGGYKISRPRYSEIRTQRPLAICSRDKRRNGRKANETPFFSHPKKISQQLGSSTDIAARNYKPQGC